MFLTGEENFTKKYECDFRQLNRLGFNHRKKLDVAATILVLTGSGEYEILKSRHLLTRDEYKLYYNSSYSSYKKYLKEFIGEFIVKTPSEIREMDIKDFEHKNIIIKERY